MLILKADSHNSADTADHDQSATGPVLLLLIVAGKSIRELTISGRDGRYDVLVFKIQNFDRFSRPEIGFGCLDLCSIGHGYALY